MAYGKLKPIPPKKPKIDMDLAYGKLPYFKPDDVIFQLYKNSVESTNITIDDPTIRKHFDPVLPTRIFIHGFIFIGDHVKEMGELAQEYHNKFNGSVNYIAVNWIKGANTPNYSTAVEYVYIVGMQVARFLNFLLKTFTKKFWHLLVMIGFSLGAHAMGVCE